MGNKLSFPQPPYATFSGFIRLFFFALILTGCGSSEKSPEKGKSVLPEPILPAAEQRYFHFSGSIGNRSASIDLVRERGYEGEPFFSGYFTFDDEEKPIPVYSENGDSLKTLILKEAGDNQHQNGMFSGTFISGSYSGTYISQNGKTESFRLRLSGGSGSTRFRSLSSDTFFAALDSGNSPKARFSWHFLQPEEKWLRDSLLLDLHGDSLFRLGKGNPQTIFSLLGQQYAEDYRDEVRPLIGEEDAFGILEYDLSYGMEVMFNRHGLLSLAFTQYQYTGGAHGLMYSRCVSYDMMAKKRIRKEDLFRPGYENRLKTVLNEAAKKKYGVKKLSEILLVDEIGISANFFVTGKGICFVYQPYEIGPFSMGEQEIYLPFSDIKDIMK